MSKYPKIKFIASKEVDLKNALSFVKRRKGHDWFVTRFLHANLQYILRPEFSWSLQQKILKAYTEVYYKQHLSEITKGNKQAEQDWHKVEKSFYQLVDKLFYGRPWPKGNYRGFASIWWVFPRYIQDKVFFFPYQHKLPRYSNGVVAHEMLHFMFFDYVKEFYGLKKEDSKIKNKPANYLWQVSEVFNNVIESWPSYFRIAKRQVRPYPGLEKMYKLMQKDWQKKQDVKWLLDKWLK